jgi:hypothetical protein
MTTQSQGTGPGPLSKPQSEVQEFLVKRDMAGPLSFAGVLLAKATRQAGMAISSQTLEAAVYQTRGRKYITTLSKRFAVAASLTAIADALNPVEDLAGPDSGYNKAEVHDTFEAAMDWFKPGRLTDEIRRQLGLDQPVRIE